MLTAETPAIPAVLECAAEEFGAREALVDGRTRLSFHDLYRLALGVTKALHASGVRQGDRVAVWAPNGHRWVAAALGAVAMGAVLVPVNTRFKGAEAGDVLLRSRARTLFVEDGFLGNGYLDMLRSSASGAWPVPTGSRGFPLPDLREAVSFDAAARSGAVTWDDFLESGSAVPDSDALALWRAVAPDDIADVLFTSGTTGRPKGVLCTHLQNIATYTAWSDRTGLTAGDRYLIINPMFHSFGYKAGILACLLRGATMVLQPVFDVEETMAIIERERIAVLPGPPTLYISLLDAPGRADRDLSSLRLAVTGAAVVPVPLVRRIREELFPQVVTAYGLTESCGTVTACTVGEDDETVATTSGRAIDGVRVTVVDGAGRPVATGEEGEVTASGPTIMVGYLDDPAATAEAVRDGWLRTGDAGRLDAAGNLTITGRLKDMLTVGGFNVAPAEVEQVLAAHPRVAESAVVAAPDPRLGEVGHAHIVLRPGTVPDASALIAHCRTRLAGFKVPRHITFARELPRNAAGKVDKARLRQEVPPSD